MRQILIEEGVEFCNCGKVKKHIGRCLGVKFGETKERIPKYSGKSNSINRFNDYK
jgi:hypothetical protein